MVLVNTTYNLSHVSHVRAREGLNKFAGFLWRKVKAVKARLGILSDLLVIALAWWAVKEYVPYGKVITDVIFLLFLAMVVFSVIYILYVRIRKEVL